MNAHPQIPFVVASQVTETSAGRTACLTMSDGSVWACYGPYGAKSTRWVRETPPLPPEAFAPTTTKAR
jgi:hypothetical protein